MPWVLLTTAVQLFGAAVILVGILQTGALSFAGTRQLVDPDASTDTPLVPTGIYAYVRHPLCTGGYLVIWACPFLGCNLLTLFIILTLYLVPGARLEEKRMLQEFGEAYGHYQREVPKLIPRIVRRG